MELRKRDAMPSVCIHQQSTEYRCDDCFRMFGRRYSLIIIGDMAVYRMFVLVSDDLFDYVESKAAASDVPMLLDRLTATDFLPDYETWLGRVNQHLRVETQGSKTTESFKQDWEEVWSQHTLPRQAALAVIGR